MGISRDRAYAFQVEARGIVEPRDLQAAFRRCAVDYGARLRRFLPPPPATAVDCGCGYGNFLFFLRSLGYSDAVGVDMDPRQVDLARSLGLAAVEGDALAYLADLPPSSTDLVSAVDFVEHLSKDDSVRFFTIVRNALRIGGTVVFRTPCSDTLLGSAHRDNDITHEWGMTSGVALNMLRMCGLSPVAVLDERPVRGAQRYAVARLLAFHLVRLLSIAALAALRNPSPRVWTPSMWVIGRRLR
jgi:SAM-dependent methyltransferase